MTTYQTFFVLFATALAGCATDAARADAPKQQLVQVPSAALTWTEFFPGGPQDAFVIGSRDAKRGPTAFFFKMKGGFDSGWHTHESAYHAVVLAGTVLETSKGSEASKPLGPGSYYFQPAVVHKTACVKGADCLTYIYEDGRFSFTPTTEDGKPVARP